MSQQDKNTQINQEYSYRGSVINGFVMVAVEIALVILDAWLISICAENPIIISIIAVIGVIFAFCMKGFFTQQPNCSRVLTFFGKYVGTFRETGFFWINPFVERRTMSLRIHNMDIDPIKVNDKLGNPVLIGMVLVWKVEDTYRAVFDVDSSGTLEEFVRIQGDAALREVTGHYAYDNIDNESTGLTLRSGGEEINELLEKKINEHLSMAGITVVEARINYLAYAPEIAAVMLRRQQATAIISAREKIVEGAVSMVKMALDQLSERGVVELDSERRAAMVSNLLVVLCADEPAQPVLNTGTLYQ
ncbi:MAG: SPFH domain-containing protein [Clostridia bacterium]|nr:SPFH domain-containing protein [Clostridia bacterium]